MLKQTGRERTSHPHTPTHCRIFHPLFSCVVCVLDLKPKHQLANPWSLPLLREIARDASVILAELDPSFHVSYRDVTFYRNGGDLKDVEICVNFVTTCRSSAEGWSCLGGVFGELCKQHVESIMHQKFSTACMAQLWKTAPVHVIYPSIGLLRLVSSIKCWILSKNKEK